MTIIQKSYPTLFRDFDPEGFAIQTKLWGNAFYDFTFQECFAAFEIWLNTEVYPPQPVQLKNILKKIAQPKNDLILSPEMAWETVDRAVRRYGSYGQEQAFNGFTEQTKRAVRNVGGWQRICSTELGKEWDFLRKNFIEAYNDFGADDKQQELLSTPILQRLQEMKQQHTLENRAKLQKLRLEQGE